MEEDEETKNLISLEPIGEQRMKWERGEGKRREGRGGQ